MPIAFSWLGAVVAAAVVGFPLLVLSITLAMKGSTPGSRPCRGRSAAPGGAPSGASRFPSRGRASSRLRPRLRARTRRVRGDDHPAGRIEGETETIPLAVYAALEAPGGEQRIGGLIGASIVICLACVFAARALDNWHRRRLELAR